MNRLVFIAKMQVYAWPIYSREKINGFYFLQATVNLKFNKLQRYKVSRERAKHSTFGQMS